MSFKRLDPEDITISAESVVSPLWSSTNSPTLTTFFTSSAQATGVGTGNFFYTVYDLDVNTNASAVPQFDIAFGDKYGRGVNPYNASVPQNTYTSTIYGQYRNLVFGADDVDFQFLAQTSSYIYAITIDRARYKEKLLPGTFNLTLTSGSRTLHLTDNSTMLSTVSYVDAGRVFDIISGSNGAAYNASGSNSLGGSYGKLLPDVGIIILNGTALDSSVDGLNLGTDLGSGSLSLPRFFSAIKTGAAFQLQSEETITSDYVFVRVRNSEFNYTTNPSNLTSSGQLRYDVMINTPQAYVTAVGLYNDNNDLLGVAKLSRPLLKDFTKEALIRIKLDY